jgi:hypothetical protein
MGWGSTKTVNAMSDNRIYANKINHYAKHMYDVAAIYTLSAQPASVISNNYVDSIYVAPYAHHPNHWFYLYTNEGSSYFTIRDNWCPAEKFLQNANGPDNVWQNNGPKVSDSIKNFAGIEQQYQYLLKEKTVDANWPINHYIPATVNKEVQAQTSTSVNAYDAINKPLVIEVVGAKGEAINESELLKVFNRNSISATDIYKWNNHVVSFATVKDTMGLRRQIVSRYPTSKVNIYNDMVYVFNRERCNDKTIEREWDNVVYLSYNCL